MIVQADCLSQNAARRCRGFTLLEAMIALLVLSVGLLGLAALQGRAMQYNQDSLVRGQATALANELIDSMRSRALNKSGIQAVNALSAYAGAPAANCPDITASATISAAEEKRCWLSRIQDANFGLPGAANANGIVQRIDSAGAVIVADGTPTDPSDDIYQISMQWVERGRTTDDAGNACNPCISTQNFAFQP